MEHLPIRYRTWHQATPPRPIRLEVPGWAGKRNAHADGDEPQPWHCTPFVEASTYGLEISYAFDTECSVVLGAGGRAEFIGDFSSEQATVPGTRLPPFSSFAPGHFGTTSCLDIKVPDGYVLRIEPHPRFFTDETNSCPCAVPGHLATSWWPKMFFVVFRNPAPGQTIVFRKGEPYAQLLVVPRRVSYLVSEMDASERSSRSTLDERIDSCQKSFVVNDWNDHVGNNFNDKYRILNNISIRKGADGVIDFLDDVQARRCGGKRPVRLMKYVKRRVDEGFQDKEV